MLGRSGGADEIDRVGHGGRGPGSSRAVVVAQPFVEELWWDNMAGIGRRGRRSDPVDRVIEILDSWIMRSNP